MGMNGDPSHMSIPKKWGEPLQWVKTHKGHKSSTFHTHDVKSFSCRNEICNTSSSDDSNYMVLKIYVNNPKPHLQAEYENIPWSYPHAVYSLGTM